MNPQNISGIIGRTLALNLVITLDEAPRNVINDTLRAYLKTSEHQLDADALASLTEGDGITITDSATGLAQVVFSNAHTTQNPGNYFYHATLETTSGALYSIAHGRVTLERT